MITSSYTRSVLMIILGGLCLSFLGIGDRSMDAATGPQVVLYRALGQSVFLAGVFLIFRNAPMSTEFKSLTWRGYAVVLLMALAGFFLIMSIQFTLIANAVFIISLTPLIAALLAWIFLKEIISRRTMIAMIIAFTGVGVIFGSNMNLQGITGMGLALTMAVCYAGALVTMRVIPNANVFLMCALSGLLTVLLMIPIVESFHVTTKDLLICLAMGCFQVGLGTVLVLMGAQHVPAAQVSILALVEVVLGPVWVWIFASEMPSPTTLIGGGIVLCGVVYQALAARDETSKT